MECVVCGRECRRGKRGPARKTCSTRCRVRLSRMRKGEPVLFPAVMQAEKRWVRADGKRPIMPDGSAASSTNPATWSALSDVREGKGDGMGFMLGGGIGCYDLDHALDDGALKSWAKTFIETIREPIIYTEVSQSGEGLHLFILADEGRGTRARMGDGAVERYTQGRFIRTGKPVQL